MRLYIFIQSVGHTANRSGWASNCLSLQLLLWQPLTPSQESVHVLKQGQGHCFRNTDNLLSVLPLKQRRCAEQHHLICPQCSSQPCQPPQSLRISAPGLFQTTGLSVKLLAAIFKVGKFWKTMLLSTFRAWLKLKFILLVAAQNFFLYAVMLLCSSLCELTGSVQKEMLGSMYSVTPVKDYTKVCQVLQENSLCPTFLLFIYLFFLHKRPHSISGIGKLED